MFLKQNPGEAHLSIDELHEMAASSNANILMLKVSKNVGQIAGTNAYWNTVREKLKANITSVGAPTFFHFPLCRYPFAFPKFKRSLVLTSSTMPLLGRTWDGTFCFVPKFHPTMPFGMSLAPLFL